MTDTAPAEPTAAPANPEVQAALDKIKAQRAEADEKAAAAAEAEDARTAKLDEVKAKVEAAVGPIAQALAEATDPAERDALMQLEEETMAPLRAELEAAYAEFAGPQESNPAPPGTTEIDSGVSVTGGANA